jgi:hypothetical protein
MSSLTGEYHLDLSDLGMSAGEAQARGKLESARLIQKENA